MKLGDEIVKAFSTFKTFSFDDLRILLSEKHSGISDKIIQVTVSRMIKKGRLHKVIKGVYSLEPRSDFAGFAFSPFYYGGLAALMIMELIDDQVKMDIMTTRRVKKSMIEIYGGRDRIFLHHIPSKYYFGFKNIRYGDIIVPVSDPEKTIIDLFYYKDRMSIQDYAEVLKKIKSRKLREYLKVYDNHTRKTVMNFVRKYKKLADAGELDNPY